jgi:hypothetical protein
MKSLSDRSDSRSVMNLYVTVTCIILMATGRSTMCLHSPGVHLSVHAFRCAAQCLYQRRMHQTVDSLTRTAACCSCCLVRRRARRHGLLSVRYGAFISWPPHVCRRAYRQLPHCLPPWPNDDLPEIEMARRVLHVHPCTVYARALST